MIQNLITLSVFNFTKIPNILGDFYKLKTSFFLLFQLKLLFLYLQRLVADSLQGRRPRESAGPTAAEKPTINKYELTLNLR